jgi:hypothetical protein
VALLSGIILLEPGLLGAQTISYLEFPPGTANTASLSLPLTLRLPCYGDVQVTVSPATTPVTFLEQTDAYNKSAGTYSWGTDANRFNVVADPNAQQNVKYTITFSFLGTNAPLASQLFLVVAGLANNTTATVSTVPPSAGGTLAGEFHFTHPPSPHASSTTSITTSSSAATLGSIANTGDPINTGWALYQTQPAATFTSLSVDMSQVPGDGAGWTLGYLCGCASTGDASINCQLQNGGANTYSYGFTFTNNSPFSAPATSIDISSTAVTSLTPSSPVPLVPPVPQGGQGAVQGAFTVSNPQPGSQVCLNIKLSGGGDATAWCCPSQQVCFRLPNCSNCAKAQGVFQCRPDGTRVLNLTVTNTGPSPVSSVQVFSTTPGVTVTPTNTSLSLASSSSTTVQLGVTGAAPGQTIDLTVNLHGPIDPATGLYTWCCTSTLRVVYPRLEPCQ